MSAARFFARTRQIKTAVERAFGELHARNPARQSFAKVRAERLRLSRGFSGTVRAASANATNASMQKYRLHQMTYRRFRRSGNATCLRSLGFMASRS